MNLQITSVAYAPDDLYSQVPFEVTLLKKLPGPDRPDYWRCAVKNPIRWLEENVERSVTHVTLAARYVDTYIGPEVPRITVGIAYVTDSSLIADAALDFGKIKYVAIGEAVQSQ